MTIAVALGAFIIGGLAGAYATLWFLFRNWKWRS